MCTFSHLAFFTILYIALPSFGGTSHYGASHNSHPIFISLVLLVIAVAMLRDTVSRSKAKHITRTVEISFRDRRASKPRIALFQTLACLYFRDSLGAETESPDSLWSIMGMTMRMAFATGSHRNPCRFGNITPFRAEMRKDCGPIFANGPGVRGAVRDAAHAEGHGPRLSLS
jgi:hypothetical protein